jgi:hypothetical protein
VKCGKQGKLYAALDRRIINQKKMKKENLALRIGYCLKRRKLKNV